MAGIATNVLQQGLMNGMRLASYTFGVSAAHKISVLGMRAVTQFVATITPDTVLTKATNAKQSIAAYIPANASLNLVSDKTTSMTALIGQIIAVALIAIILHDVAHYFGGSTPPLFNTILRMTPFRVADQSVFSACTETIGRLHAFVQELYNS